MRPLQLAIGAVAGALLALSGCTHTQRAQDFSTRDVVKVHLSKKEYAQALPLLESLHKEAPDDLEIARALTEAHVRTHRAQPFIARLEAGTEPRSKAVTHYMLGLARFAGAAEADRAIAEFESASALSPSEPEFQYRLGLALVESEDYARALPPLRKARELAPGRNDVLLPLAQALHRTADAKGAIEALRQLVNADPTPAEIAKARAIMDAIADPFVRFPKSAQGRLDEGLAWLQDRDVPQQAIIAFEEILRDYPDLGVVHTLLGLAYQRIDDAGRAVEELKKAIELSPEDGRNHLYLGLLYQSRQRTEQAAPHFQKALERNPLLDDAYFALGDHFLERRELDKAHQAFRVLTRLQPDAPAARGKYALVLQLQENFPAADRELRAILEKDPANVEFMLRLGVLHLERRNQAKNVSDRNEASREAEVWLRKVLEAQPENAVASRALESLRVDSSTR